MMSAAPPVFDGHNDILTKLYFPQSGEERSFFERRDFGHLDLPRAIDGGFGGGLFAVMPLDLDMREHRRTPSKVDRDGYWEVEPAPEVDYETAHHQAVALSAALFRWEEESGGRLKVVTSGSELSESLEGGVVAAVLHFEGAEAIDQALDGLEVFYRAGLRSMGITWSRPNAFGHGVPFRFPHEPDIGPGLTDLGKRLVRECNRLGIMVDVSHLNEAGFWDVVDISEAPVVATHSNAHALCQMSRNLTDKQLDAIRDSDGLVGVNFSVTFLREDGERDLNTPISEILRHLDYLVERIGIDRVALGSDFDGAPIPNEIGDVTGLPKLIAALRERGYDDEAVRKISHENWVRVLRATWRS